jgi:hypothetical protein
MFLWAGRPKIAELLVTRHSSDVDIDVDRSAVVD